MKEFHPLAIERIEPETKDSVRISLGVPEDLAAEYQFRPGQHLPFEIELDGKKLRRTYSICSAAGDQPLEIGVRVQPGGAFGEFGYCGLLHRRRHELPRVRVTAVARVEPGREPWR